MNDKNEDNEKKEKKDKKTKVKPDKTTKIQSSGKLKMVKIDLIRNNVSYTESLNYF